MSKQILRLGLQPTASNKPSIHDFFQNSDDANSNDAIASDSYTWLIKKTPSEA